MSINRSATAFVFSLEPERSQRLRRARLAPRAAGRTSREEARGPTVAVAAGAAPTDGHGRRSERGAGGERLKKPRRESGGLLTSLAPRAQRAVAEPRAWPDVERATRPSAKLEAAPAITEHRHAEPRPPKRRARLAQGRGASPRLRGRVDVHRSSRSSSLRRSAHRSAPSCWGSGSRGSSGCCRRSRRHGFGRRQGGLWAHAAHSGAAS
jgi:hypothetical protein